jgi:hypothetical protein
MFDWPKVQADSLEQLRYYNNDSGTDLAEIHLEPVRARSANVAACLVDSQRFIHYLDYSGFWRIELVTAARTFLTKPDDYLWKGRTESFKRFLIEMRERLLVDVSLQLIYRTPAKINYRIDLMSIEQMLLQLCLEQEGKL